MLFNVFSSAGPFSLSAPAASVAHGTLRRTRAEVLGLALFLREGSALGQQGINFLAGHLILRRGGYQPTFILHLSHLVSESIVP